MEIDLRTQLRSYLGVYEWELLPHFRRLVRRGTKCFDIGGRDGYDALMMASLSRDRVVSFDCDHLETEKMRRTFALNPGLSIKVVEAFVGSRTDDNGMITIDEAVASLFVPGFIKMDIEGAEADALEGAVITMRDHHPGVIIEVHGEDQERRCIAILRELQYKIDVVNPSRFFVDTFRSGYNRWIVAAPSR